MKNTSGNFCSPRSEAWIAIAAGVERQVLGYDKDIMLVDVRFENGGVGAPHSHPHRQVSYISEGRFEVTIGGETKTLSFGDSFFVPANAVHGVVALEKGRIIDVFHPMREEFVKEEKHGS